MRPGADDVKNPVKDWKKYSDQNYNLPATLGSLGDIEHILLAKYGSDSWDPTSLTAQGKDTVNGEMRYFNSHLHALTEKNNKWVFAKRD